jgi:exodeoxyribonuclease V
MLTFTLEQMELLTAINQWIETDDQVFCFQGRAGTGKSVVLAYVANQYGCKLMAPTGKAASVAAKKAGREPGTLHRFLYAPPREDANGNPEFYEKNCRYPGSWGDRRACIDEGSMIGHKLAADLLETGVRCIIAGDPGQLPPVNDASYFIDANFTLHEIHRQAAGSGIITQANIVRDGGDYQTDGSFRVVDKSGARDLIGSGWPDIVLCYTNTTRHQINQHIRQLKGMSYTAPPVAGEPVMCLENHSSGMRNGEIFTVKPFDPRRGIELADGPAQRGSIFGGMSHLRAPWLEWQNLGQKQPRRCASFALAYAATVHKAQGSEWPRVLIFDEFDGADRARWVYTAITRGAQEVAIYKVAQR